MVRDDIYEYSLDTHHNEEQGKLVRKKIFKVTLILSVITALEVVVGIFFPKDSVQGYAWTMIKIGYILLTVVKAGYIVMVFMHLGDERKNLRWVILAPYLVLIGYLIFICLTEAVYAGENRAWDAVVEAFKAVTGSGAAHH